MAAPYCYKTSVTCGNSNKIYFHSCKNGCDNRKERWNKEFKKRNLSAKKWRSREVLMKFLTSIKKRAKKC